MKKKPKGKQNWFKVQFKKHPYIYTFLIGWIILFFPNVFLVPLLEAKFGNPDNGVLSIIFDVPGFIFLLFPLIIFFLWFRKNKSKIKPFFKRRKKILKPFFYTVGGLISFAIISLIITVITLGGFANFTERAKFEYLVWNDQHDLCSQPGIAYTGYGEYSKFFWKANFQFIDYFKYKPYTVVKNVVNLKDDFLYNFNHCKATRYLLRAAHQDHKIAKDILAAYPENMDFFYEFDDKYLFERYRNSLDEKKLYNAALVNAFAEKTDQEGNFLSDLEKRRKLHKEAAEEGYLLGMQDYLLTFSEEKGKKINKSECPFILKYSNHLYEQKSLMDSFAVVMALIGKISMDTTRAIYECSDKKTDFAKAILLLKNFNDKMQNPNKTSSFATTYPAIIYFNGWGNVEKDQKLAYELFIENNYGSKISKAYLAFIELNSPNTENHKKGLKLLNKMFDRADYTSTHDIYCNNIKYDFRNKEEREKVSLCLSEASNDERIDSVKSYIKSWIENWFKNPELVETLNLFG